MDRDIPTYLIDLPYRVPGLSSVDENGDPTVYLNARLSSVQHRRTYEHELQHLRHDDFFSEEAIEAVEARAQGKPVPAAPPPAPSASPPPVSLPKPRKPARRRSIIQTPKPHQYSVAELVVVTIERAPEHYRPFLRWLFSRRAATNDEALVRAWLLFGITAQDSRWEAILSAYAYNGIYRREGGRRAGESDIKPLTPAIRKLVDAVFNEVTIPRPGE